MTGYVAFFSPLMNNHDIDLQRFFPYQNLLIDKLVSRLMRYTAGSLKARKD
jgi:hypothetical protein